jgi:hypothetical protein
MGARTQVIKRQKIKRIYSEEEIFYGQGWNNSIQRVKAGAKLKPISFTGAVKTLL